MPQVSIFLHLAVDIIRTLWTYNESDTVSQSMWTNKHTKQQTRQFLSPALILEKNVSILVWGYIIAILADLAKSKIESKGPLSHKNCGCLYTYHFILSKTENY
jgi:hypothetical protein